MPLNLTINDGDFVPYLKYNAKAGRFYAKAEGGQGEVEILNPMLAFDMSRIKTGWLFYSEGSGPEKVWDASPEIAAPRPAGPRKFKRGFEVMVVGNGKIPGTQERLGLREFSSTATNVITSMLRMYAEYEAGLAANRGKVPVYACTGVVPITGSYGVNYEPTFVLRQWVERSRVPEFDTHASGTQAAQQRKPDPISTAPQRMNGSHGDDPGYDPATFDRPAPDTLNDDIPF
jgi:hypothetical protein